MKIELINEPQNDFCGFRCYWENEEEKRQLTEFAKEYEIQHQKAIEEYERKLPYYKARAEAIARGEISVRCKYDR